MALLPGEPPHADDVAERGTKEWRQAVVTHRDWIGNQLWTQQATSGLDLSNQDSLKAALSKLGVENEVGGGRHAYNLFTGQLPSEGFGFSQVASRTDMPFALEAYMPDWKFNLDRSIQSGTPRLEANQQFLPPEALVPGAASYPHPSTAAAATAPTPATAPAPATVVPGGTAPVVSAPNYSATPGMPGSSGSPFLGSGAGFSSGGGGPEEKDWEKLLGITRKKPTLGTLGGY